MDIQQVAATPAVTQTANSSSDDLGQDAFLQLLVTQLKYQDPLNPLTPPSRSCRPHSSPWWRNSTRSPPP